MKTLERFISSSVTTIVLLLIYAFGLAIATFIEKYHGTAAAKAMIYRRFPERTPCSLPTLWAGIYRRYRKD